MRAAMSVLPPAGYATIICTGLVGKAWANTEPVKSASTRVNHFFMTFLL